MTQEGGSDKDIKSRLGKARAAFSKLRNIWKSSQLKLKTKLKIFKSNVIALTWVPEGRRSCGRPKETEPQRKKEQLWVLSHGARQQWLCVTV